ncbi:MAG: AAA family ATPase [Solobacterium sp.]|nr:AAA family ATPase [Solobacterium sp.]
MNNRDRKQEEKERLMNEVLGKRRTGETLTTDEMITLSQDLKTQTDELADTMSRSDRTMDALREILEQQQKDLETLSALNGMNSTYESDIEKVRRELEKDYGVATPEVPQKHEPVNADEKVFEEAKVDLIDRAVIGQKQADQLMISFRRPFVMGTEPGKARNVLVISGPKGSGRHAALSTAVRCLYERQVLLSDEVYTVDMSLYQSGAQEQIFLQDLYKGLTGRGEVLCFENFETGFPSFLRMVNSLVCDGKVILSKRYVLNKGILVENQTGLVKDAVDSFSADGKYLVFFTTKGTGALQDAFGASFLYHVLDTITFTALDEAGVDEVIEKLWAELEKKCTQNLALGISYEPEFIDWIKKHYDKTNGMDAIASLFNDFYINLSQVVLDKSVWTGAETVLKVTDDRPVAVFGDTRITLTRSKTSAEELAAVNEELDNIVGLNMVKDYIKQLQSHIQVQAIRREQGMKTASISMHMIYTGNPGTGKTTIARLLSRYMKAIGALSQGQLVEVTRADLVAQYVGQTAPLTMSVIKSAMGGVLFIDEAYSLYRGKDDAFGLECIDTIVKAMEDNRDDLIVILAGYKKEMATFLESNSGLKSRFPNVINFPDYTGEELYRIAVLQAKGKGYVLADEVTQPLTEYFDKVQSINAAEAGNGRLARNVVEDAILAQSERIMKDASADMTTLLLEDFDLEVKVQPPKEEPNPFAAFLNQ